MPTNSPLLKIWQDNRAALLRYFTTRLRSREAAEDLLHDLYVKLAATPIEALVEDSTAYLFRAARNLLINYLRGYKRARQREDGWINQHVIAVGSDLIAPAPSPEIEVTARHELALILRIIDDLPLKTRTIFRLHRLEGMTQGQVALHMSISKRTVETHLATALWHLMEQLPSELRRSND